MKFKTVKIFLALNMANAFAVDVGLDLDFQAPIDVMTKKVMILDDPNSVSAKQEKMNYLLTIRTAINYLSKNPERIDDYVNQDEYFLLKKNLNLPTFEETLNSLRGNTMVRNNQVMLNPRLDILYSLGSSILNEKNPEVLELRYLNGLKLLPQAAIESFPPVSTFKQSSTDSQLSYVNSLEDYLSEYRDEAEEEAKRRNTDSKPAGYTSDCSKEYGYVPTIGDGEVSQLCSKTEYSSRGLYLNTEFPLKYYSTCIKNQGNRGTCVAHAVSAALESYLYKTKGSPYNLSEQYAYFKGEVEYQRRDRYEYGLITWDFIKSLNQEQFAIPYEFEWNYNLSSDMESLNEKNKHPESCTYYSQGICSNYAFQTSENKVGNHWYYVAPLIGSSAPSKLKSYDTFFTATKARRALDKAIVYLADRVPVVVSTSATRALTEDDNRGYVKYLSRSEVKALNAADGITGDAADYDLGGHAMVLIGFVKNSDLPSGVTKAEEEGYFIVKNSWGLNGGDCGFYYVDYKYFRKHSVELAAIL